MRERLTMPLLFACLSLGFSALACGGVTGATDAPPLGDDDGGSLDDAGNLLGDDGGTSSDDGGPIVTKDGGAASLAIDPIATGNAWTYDVTVAGSYAACTNGSATSTVGQAQSVGGKSAFLVSSFCPSLGSFWYAPDGTGDRVFVYDGSKWTTALDAPVQDGHTWSGAGDTLVWKNAGSVTVPAGTFGDCFTAEDEAAPSYYAVTFCRGVGPVKWHYRDISQNGYDAVLTAKSF